MNSDESEIFQRMICREGIRSELRAANALAIKQWKIEFSYPLSVLWFILMPFIWFIPMFFAGIAVSGGSTSEALLTMVGTDDWISYVAIGMSFNGLALSIFWGTSMVYRREQNVGTLETLMTTPVRPTTIVWGSMLHNIQHGGLGVILQLLVAVIFFGVNINAWGILPALVIVALGIIGFQGVVLTMVCIVLVAKRGWMIVEFVSDALLLVAPISYPILILPPILQYLALASPLTWTVDSFRWFLMYGPFYPGALTAIGVLLFLDAIFLVFGIVLFRVTERHVRRRGALAQF